MGVRSGPERSAIVPLTPEVENLSADAYGPQESLLDSADFTLSPREIAKGQRAVEAFLVTVKPGDNQRSTEEALDTLAAVITNGQCDHRSFPWQQVRAHHGALALSIVREPGAPGRIEVIRCRADDTRKFQQVPESYPPKQVQRMRHALVRVIESCSNLGFLDDNERDLAIPPARGQTTPPRNATHERILTESEVRAILSACDLDDAPAAARDALMISLAYSGGLKTVDLINLTLDSLVFDEKRGQVTIRYKPPGTKRARTVPLQNEDLISLEDWLEIRAREPGPLFCHIKPRTRQIEYKRISAAAVREVCDQRAEQAGVLHFSPNDLARSGAQKAEANRRRKRQEPRDTSQVSVLFPDSESGSSDLRGEDLNFPYRARTGH